MKPCPKNRFTPRILLRALVFAAGLALPLPSLAGPVALATSPLATSTTSTVKPNITLVMDDSGSMAWDHMPDDTTDGGSAVTFSYGYYGVRGSQCNQVYYDPTITYLPPVDAAGVSYANASFTGAWTDGFKTSSGTVDLRTGFTANQTGLGGNAGGTDAATGAYFYQYSGTQTTQTQKNYNGAATTTFNLECHSAQGATPGTTVFGKRRLNTTETTTITVSGTGTSTSSVTGITVNGLQIMKAASATATNISSTTLASNIAAQINLCTAAASGNCTTSGYSAVAASGVVTITGPTSAANFTPVISPSASMGTITLTADVFPDTTAANLTNFANWYSYYRTRILMMKTATGRAFGSLNQKYRVGFMKLSSSSTPTTYLDTFWNNTDPTLGPVSTQRTNWYNAVYAAVPGGSTPLRTALSDAGRYYAGKLAGADSMQYSCQQNFAILSTDGYWNTGNPYQIDGSSPVGNQDGTAGRPMYDGAQATTTWQFTYTRNTYAKVTTGCTSGKWKLKTTPQIGTCSKSVSTGSCTPASWIADAANPATTSTTCTSTAVPATSAAVLQPGSPVPTPGSSGGSSDSLADVAMYYYQTDLRTKALNNCTGAPVPPATTGNILCTTPDPVTGVDPYNNVFQGATDKNQQQHMNTFTLGLGASGWMNYSSSYLNDTSGDFVAVKLGSTATSTVCSWQAAGTVCNWPLPGMDSSGNGFIANVDDLWHAAVNGRGAYFSATNPTTLAAGLSNALTSINAKIGSAAAAATSTLNPVAGNNFAYVASYTTVLWQGNLEARGINVDTGVVDQNASWCVENVAAQTCPLPGTIVADTSGATTVYNCVTPNAVICNDPGVLVGTDCQEPIATACTGTMNALVTDASDTRTIKTANSTSTALINFDAAYATANPANFAAAKISALSQWSTLTAAQQTAAQGVNLVNYLRGQHGHEFDRTSVAVVDQLYRNRQSVLGDALESQPAFIGAPIFSYPYPGYSGYLTAQAARAGTVYMGTNDGMMHGFASDTGVERWAYVPSMVIPNMWKLADTNYAVQHANLVNGSPITSDVCTANCTNSATAVWKTILVAGLNGGGRGYYALDITVPTAPVFLWEFTPANDSDLGYTYGQPVITKKIDGTWVVLVTSGYDNGTDSSQFVSGTTFIPNSPAGSGIGYLYVLNAGTGAIISKISTGVGTAAAPSGLAKIAGWNNDPAGNEVSYTYGGDLLGNVWRFDINSPVGATIGTGAVLKFATLFDAAGTAQPVTTTPVLGTIVGKRVIFVGTGKYLETGDLTTTQKQTQYAIKDDNATATLVNPRTTLVNQTLTNNPNGTATRLSSGNTVNFFTGRGWYVDFPDSGERVNIDSKLVQGTLLVPTIVPSNTVCSPGGFGWLNFLDYTTGGSVTPIPGIPLSSEKYDSTIVGINVLFIQGAPIVEVVTSTNPTPTKNPDVAFKASSVGFTGKRVIWRELMPQ